MSIIDQIRSYGEKVLSRAVQTSILICPKCKEEPGAFKLHEAKDRLFYIVEDNVVRKIWSYLPRWKCPVCKRTFIEYPEFAIPWKNYTKDAIFGFANKYLADEDASYRGVTRGGAIIHVDETQIDEVSGLSHSSLWRWIRFIGLLSRPLSNALNNIREKDSKNDIFRTVFPVASKKYRSHSRKIILQQALRVFDTEAKYRKLFFISIFPRFATREAWI